MLKYISLLSNTSEYYLHVGLQLLLTCSIFSWKVHEVELKFKESVKTVKDVGLDPMEDDSMIVPSWPYEFKRLQREIIGLWDACSVSLVHRTYFFLLFKGDPTDSIYMEVELRRLSFLKDRFSHGNKTIKEGQTLSPASR